MLINQFDNNNLSAMDENSFDVDIRINDFVLDYESGKIVDITLESVKLFKEIVKMSAWKSADDLLVIVKRIGSNPRARSIDRDTCFGNIVRRILKIIREEYISIDRNTNDESEESLHKIVKSQAVPDDYNKVLLELKPAILDHLDELDMEVETSSDNIAVQAVQHIHNNEVVLTLGNNDIVLKFLKEAAKHRKFEVIVASTEPSLEGNELALSLAKSKINTTLIEDSAIFGIMSRVNKVIVGSRRVMADGGLRSTAGTRLVASAAFRYSVPVFVLAPLYQLSPKYYSSTSDEDGFDGLSTPQGVLSYSDRNVLSPLVQSFSPVYDYVPPDLVTLFISNTGGHSPSYLYRHLSELYYPQDYQL